MGQIKNIKLHIVTDIKVDISNINPISSNSGHVGANRKSLSKTSPHLSKQEASCWKGCQGKRPTFCKKCWLGFQNTMGGERGHIHRQEMYLHWNCEIDENEPYNCSEKRLPSFYQEVPKI